MKWIGLTGGIGSGKSTVASMLREKGLAVIDADEMARLAVRPDSEVMQKLAQVFGPGVLNADGSLNRVALGDIVFREPAKLSILEGLVHPRVHELTQQKRSELAAGGAKVAFYDVPLLYEKKLESQFDKVIVVFADEAQQVERAMKRSPISRAEVLRRMAAQMPLVEKVKRTNLVISNDRDLEHLRAQVEEILKKI